MAYSVVSKNVPGKAPTFRGFICDLVVDIATLPIVPAVAAGSTCYCSEDGNTYVLETDGDWVVKSTGGGGGGGSGLDVEITNPQDGQVLVFNSTKNKWVNADPVSRVSVDPNENVVGG